MPSSHKRIYWVDAAKALGIFLVYYGHVLEKLHRVGHPIAFSQYKFIYAYHIPFFFFLSGFFYKRRDLPGGALVKDLLLKRILPVITFGLVILPFWPLHLYLQHGAVDFYYIGAQGYHYLRGQPDLNHVTWFLVCLFVVEMIALIFLRKGQKVFFVVFLAGAFLHFGLTLTENMDSTVLSLGIRPNTWYLHEATVAFGFYALGYALFGPLKRLLQLGAVWRFAILTISLGITVMTFDLNAPYDEFVVLMKGAWHGDRFFFLLSAFSGILFTLMLSSFIPKNKGVAYIGQNTLILIGINGIFHLCVNPYLKYLPVWESAAGVLLLGLAVATVSLLLSLPGVHLFNAYLPQLVGKPNRSGPWLPKLDTLRCEWLTQHVNTIIDWLGTTQK